MIQFNLLPDVKKQSLIVQQRKRLTIVISTFVSLISLAIFILLLVFVDIYQKVHLSNLSKQITSNSQQLSHDTNLNKILTIQNQLSTLPQIQAQTPASSRLFTFLNQITPNNTSITNLQLDFTQNMLTVTGTANNLATVNQYVDSIKYATYQVAGNKTAPANAFSNVTLSSFGYSNTTSSTAYPANYTITFNFDPTIFNNADNITLTVPHQISSRSITGQPTGLFVKTSQTNNNSSMNNMTMPSGSNMNTKTGGP